MDAEAARGVTHSFDELEDPRINRTRRHKLIDLIMIAIVAILGDAEQWTEVELFGRSKQADFRRFLDLPHGIPSHDTFNRVFNRLDPMRPVFTGGSVNRHRRVPHPAVADARGSRERAARGCRLALSV